MDYISINNGDLLHSRAFDRLKIDPDSDPERTGWLICAEIPIFLDSMPTNPYPQLAGGYVGTCGKTRNTKKNRMIIQIPES
jgi:hypothetical protein